MANREDEHLEEYLDGGETDYVPGNGASAASSQRTEASILNQRSSDSSSLTQAALASPAAQPPTASTYTPGSDWHTFMMSLEGQYWERKLAEQLKRRAEGGARATVEGSSSGAGGGGGGGGDDATATAPAGADGAFVVKSAAAAASDAESALRLRVARRREESFVRATWRLLVMVETRPILM